MNGSFIGVTFQITHPCWEKMEQGGSFNTSILVTGNGGGWSFSRPVLANPL